MTVLASVLAGLLLTYVHGSSAATSASYPNVVFSDGFESGSLSAWTSQPGNGTISVAAAAAHAGSFGARMTNTSGQFSVLAKALPSALPDSSVSFWVRVGTAAGFQTIAQARDGTSSMHMWDLAYDGANQRLVFFPYSGTGSTEIDTPSGSAPVGTWFKVEVQYTATATGGAQLYINGATQPGWGVSGDYTRSANLQIVQLWNDVVNTTDFDDVVVAAPAGSGTLPGAPTGVSGTAGNGSVALNWTAPASNGGAAITGYRITPYIGSSAQSAVLTGSAATNYTVTGLTNGTAYAFTAAAINSAGTGPDSSPSAAITPSAPAAVPGAPTGVTGLAGNASVALSWTAPSSDGGSPITGYVVTPYVGSVPGGPILTGSTQTNYTVNGLTNGTSYTFTVAAINTVGTGPNSAQSGSLAPPGYSQVIFSDGFESGSLAAWDGQPGNGSIATSTAAAHSGTYGLRMTNASGQFSVLVKALASPAVDSAVSFWVRVGSAAGLESIAQARDNSSSVHMWDLDYDGANQRFVFLPYNNSGSTEIDTSAGSAPVGSWIKVEVHYTATATGGARIYLNGQTQPGWGVSGDYTRSANLQRVQLWDDVVNTTDFDDVTVALPGAVPNAPTGVAGTPGNGSVALSWTAPTSNGGSPITGYRITPYIGSNAQASVLTGSASTTYTVTGLTNGTGYTFTVAAINNNGTGLDSAASGVVTPSAGPTVPGAPTGLVGTAGDGSVALSWTAPASNGGSAITGYAVTTYIGGVSQGSTLTGSAATTFTVTGLTNGTAYTFTVAAINAAGVGAGSAATAALTPVQGYSNVVFVDGFESGSLSAWDGAPGTGTTSVVAAAAHSGSYGLRMSNTSGQYSYLVKALPSALADSSVSFYVRIGSAAGFESIAQARDSSSGVHMWDLAYDGANQALLFYPYSNSGSIEISTGAGSAPVNTWIKVEVQYTATSTGGAQLYVNGQTRPSWGVTGNYARSANLQRVQLWDDVANTTDFDDVRVATKVPAGAVVAGAPTGVAASAHDGAASLSWTAPSSDGGSTISGYRITPYIGGVAQTPVTTGSPVTSYTVTGLTNGTAYTFTVAAINGVGVGPESAASPAVTPGAATVPGAPSGVATKAGDSNVALTWTAPSSDGGSPLTGYVITPYIGGTPQGPILTGSTATSWTVSGLTNGTAYTFAVAAINSVGTGPNSAQTAPVTPVAALSQYTNVVFSDGFESGGLANWSAPSGNGTATVVSAAARTGAFGLRITTLESQYEYVTKALSSSLGDSDVTFWVRPGTGSGVSTMAQARDGSSSLHMWDLMYDGTRHGFLFYPYSGTGSTEIFTGSDSAPAGAWIKVSIQYTATSSGGAQIYVNGQTQSSWGVSGDYTRTANLQRLQLWNEGLKNDTTSNDFDDVSIATLPPAGATPPGAPTGVSGAPLDHAVALSWTAPASDGGSPITGYSITPYIGSTPQAPVLTGSSATSFTVQGLTDGTAYTFTVAAINAAGNGPASAASAPVTPVPAPPPGAPTQVIGTPGDASVALTWTAPTSDGGSPITNYRITPYVAGVPQTPILTGSTSTSYNVTGLTNGTTYTFTVAASNASGFGTESAASAAVTPSPATVPGAPTGVSGSPRDSAVALTWTAPASNGGSAITSYRITPYIGSTAQTPVTTTSAATGFTVTGLTNGTSYTFKVAAINAVGTGPDSAASASVTPAVPPANPIVLENQHPGTTSWLIDTDRKAQNHEIEGYASATSVNKGGSISFMVSTSTSTQYTMDIYRMGWYPTGTNPDGTSCAPSCGGRLMMHVGPLDGFKQATCPTDTTQNDPNFGMTECSWTPSYTLSVPTSWTTGSYIVKLTRLDGAQLESYMTFVVRDDSSTAKIVYSLDVTTWQAYNFWGGSGNSDVGYDLYGKTNDVTFADLGNSRAYTVSFDRPYLDTGATDGAGLFMVWDFPMIRWMESKGYDMTYVTDTDLEANSSLLSGHKVFVNVGHDEYYSDNMRSNIQNAINSGVNMAFFSANNFYFRIQWGANGIGASYRRIHCDKNALPGSTTFEWRYQSPPLPENQIGGVMLNGVANDRNFLVNDANSWIYSGTGLKTYVGNGTTGVVTSGSNQNAIAGIIGYEIDARAVDSSGLSAYTSFEPAGLSMVGHSFVPAADNGVNSWSDAVLYTAPSGATVFSAGTIQWSFGLDNGMADGFCDCDHTVANAASQKITQNILDRFSGP